MKAAHGERMATEFLGAQCSAETAWLPFSMVGEVRRFAGETGVTGVTTRRISQFRGDKQVGQG